MKELYRFCPAAIYPKTHCSSGIYVKYHAFNDKPVKLKLYTSNYTWIDCPDRELLIVNDAAHTSSCRPLNENFDEFIALSPLHLTARDMGLKWGMINYIQNLNESQNHNFMDVYSHLTKEQRSFNILSDSGGFQLGRGNISFVNPEHLAQFYHKNADVGMSLDLPIGNKGDRTLLAPSAEIQKQNNRIMLKTFKAANSKTRLMNVVHGLSYEEQQAYHATVFEPACKSFSMAGVYHSSILEAVQGVYKFCFNKDIAKQYNHIHLLGIFNNKLLPAVIYMAKMYNEQYGKMLFTSDVSTAIQQSLARTYLLISEPDEPYHYQQFGLSHQLGHKPSRNLRSSFRTLSCCCPSCAAIKYTDVYTFFTGRALVDALTMHNTWTMNQYAEYLTQMVQQLDLKDYKELIRRQIGTRAKRDTLDALSFLDYAQSHGLKAAERHYSIYFPAKHTQTITGSLFASMERTEDTVGKRTAYMEKVFARYKKYFKTGIAPKTVKIQLEKKQGSVAYRSKSMSNGKRLTLRKRK